VLEVVLYGDLKSVKKYLPRSQEMNPQADHTIRVFRAYEIATTRGSWEKSGFGFVRRNDTDYLWANKNKISRRPEFQEAGNLIPQRCGCLNEDESKVRLVKSNFLPQRVYGHGWPKQLQFLRLILQFTRTIQRSFSKQLSTEKDNCSPLTGDGRGETKSGGISFMVIMALTTDRSRGDILPGLAEYRPPFSRACHVGGLPGYVPVSLGSGKQQQKEESVHRN
jgi:hypothetical protein